MIIYVIKLEKIIGKNMNMIDNVQKGEMKKYGI
jgi:hypothetical protein